MKKFSLGLVILLLLMQLPAVFAQSPAITADNAANLQPAVRLGRGVITDMAFAPDGSTLAVAGAVGVWLYDPTNLEASPKLLEGHTAPITNVEYSRDGKLIATASEDETVKLWDAATGKLTLTLENEYEVYGLAFSPDGSQVASAGWDYDISVWDTSTGNLINTLVGHSSTVYALAFSSDGSVLASGSGDYSVRLWDIANATELVNLSGHSSSVETLAFNADDTVLASGAGYGEIKLWDVANLTETATLEPESSSGVDTVVFAPDGTLIAGERSFQGSIRFWDVTTQTEASVIEEANDSAIKAMALSSDGTVLATASESQVIKLWDVANQTELGSLHEHNPKVYSVAFDSEGANVAVGDYEGQLHLWNVNEAVRSFSQEDAFSFANENQRVSQFTPDGSLLVTLDSFEAKIWDVASGGMIRAVDIDEGFPNTLEISPDGSLLVVGTSDGLLYLIPIATGQATAAPLGHTDAINSLTFSADGTQLATGSDDGTVRIWQIK